MKKETRGGLRKPTVIDEILINKVAVSALKGASATQIGEELQLDRNVIRKILNREETKNLIRSIGEESLQTAKAIIRNETSQIANKIIKVINQHLDEGNLEAVKVGLKILGFNDQSDVVKNSDTSITVIMPGATLPQPKDIVIEQDPK